MSGKFTGVDRRRDQRRQKADRRGGVRWEPNKDGDRRESYGRRKDDRTWHLSDKKKPE